MSENQKLTDRDDVREIVRQKYGAAALTVLNGEGAGVLAAVTAWAAAG